MKVGFMFLTSLSSWPSGLLFMQSVVLCLSRFIGQWPIQICFSFKQFFWPTCLMSPLFIPKFRNILWCHPHSKEEANLWLSLSKCQTIVSWRFSLVPDIQITLMSLLQRKCYNDCAIISLGLCLRWTTLRKKLPVKKVRVLWNVQLRIISLFSMKRCYWHKTKIAFQWQCIHCFGSFLQFFVLIRIDEFILSLNHEVLS